MNCNTNEKRYHGDRSGQEGVIAPLVAIFLPVMLIMAGFVVNLAYIELTRTELRIATDAASRAAGHKLVVTGQKVDARLAARNAGQRNLVARQPLLLNDADIVFGVSSRPYLTARYSFTPGASPPNSVRIIGQRTNGSDGGNVSLIVPMNGTLGTFQPVQTATSSQVEMDIVLVLDRSGSMAYGAAEDYSAQAGSGAPPASAPVGWSYCDVVPPGSRWIDLTSAVQVFTSVLQQSFASERVGLATYGSTATINVNLTTNYSLISQAIDSYSQSFCDDMTNIGSGMEEGIDAITDAFYARQGAMKVLIVMTDGRHNTGIDPIIPAGVAADENIIVYTVTFSDDSEQSRMIDVADIGGGIHYHAVNRNDLQQVFEEIATGLPTLLIE